MEMTGQFNPLKMINPSGGRKKVEKREAIPVTGRGDIGL
jgi:hypothetical protein